MHHSKAVVAIPVGVLIVQYLDIAFLKRRHKAVEALFVDHGGHSAQHDNFSAAAQALFYVLARNATHLSVISSHINIVNTRLAKTTIDNGDKHAAAFGIANWAGQRRRFKWQDN